MRVASAHQQHEGREFQLRHLKTRGVEMAQQMMDAHPRDVHAPGHGLARRKGGEQGTHQPRSLRDRDAVNLLKGDSGFLQRLSNGSAHLQQVLPRRQFRHHAAEGPMQRVLAAPHQGAEHGTRRSLLHHRRRAVVTGTFKAEDPHLDSLTW